MLAASNAGAHAGRCGGERFDIAEVVSLKVFGRLFAHDAKAKSIQLINFSFRGEGTQEAQKPSLLPGFLVFLLPFRRSRLQNYWTVLIAFPKLLRGRQSL